MISGTASRPPFHPRMPPRRHYVRHQLRGAAIAGAIIAASLALGTVGYHTACGLAWIDAFLNASMILTGMGPVDRIVSPTGKLFAASYALFSGVAFLTTMAVLFAPAVHRFLRWFHVQLAEEDQARDDESRERR